MQWIKFSEKMPIIGQEIVFCGGDWVTIAKYNEDKKLRPQRYCCNDPSCDWTYDDCGCDLIITPSCYWMAIPDIPKDADDNESN
jgi:hypothetical protein